MMTLTAYVENFGQGHFNHSPSAAVTQHVKLHTEHQMMTVSLSSHLDF